MREKKLSAKKICEDICSGHHSLNDLEKIFQVTAKQLCTTAAEVDVEFNIDLDILPRRSHPSLISPGWHYCQGQFRLDFKNIWFLKLSDLNLPPETTIKDFIDKFGKGNSPNEAFLDHLLSKKISHLLPLEDLKGKETLFLGTGYLGSGKEWVRSLYIYNSEPDWGMISTTEFLTKRDFQIAFFRPERMEKVI